MKVVELEQYGGALHIAEREELSPGAGQVRVRVEAAAVNPIDRYTASGAFSSWAAHIPLPVALGTDVAGVVDAAGEGSSFRVGERVAGFSVWFEQGTGTFAESVVLDCDKLVALPAGVDPVLAATIPLAGLTARQALDLAQLQAGQRLLITGASGAVGGFAVQLANAAGVRVTAVASAGDEDRLRQLGASDILLRDELTAAFGSGPTAGLDAVLDAAPVGPQLIAAVRDGGTFVTVLDSTLPQSERGVQVAKVSAAANGSQLSQLMADLAAGRLHTVVVAQFPLTQAQAAFDLSAQHGLRGKVVLVP